MPLIDHLSVSVSDIARARKFYDPVLAALGIGCLAADVEFAAYGHSRPEFLPLLPYDGDAVVSQRFGFQLRCRGGKSYRVRSRSNHQD